MLPSQSARPSASRAHMYRRTRGRKAPFIIVPVVVFAVVFGVVKFWPGSNRETLESANAAANGDQSTETRRVGVIDPPIVNPAPTQPKTEPKPLTPPVTALPPSTEKISMGSAAPQHGATSPTPERDAGNDSEPTPPADTSAHNSSSMLAAAPATTDRPDAPTAPAASPDTNATGRVSPRLASGLDLLARNKPVEARKTLTDALLHEKLTPAEADRIRQTLTAINQKLVFGPDVVPGDTLSRTYTVESGDALAKLPRKLGLKTDYRFIARINNVQSDSLRVGQRLKVVNGPFHALVIKSEFRMDVFAGEWDQRVFVCSFPVGLGEYGATPEGVFAVRPNSKLIDPEWVNPRTGEKFESSDPKNPIGERWIGLIGVSDNIRELSGYGIHGTIDPDSIGQQKSMGCVRMRADDVAIIYELLLESGSRIEIHGADYP